MVCKKKFCNKSQYYKNQAQKGGSIGIKRYSTSRRQKGYGLLSSLAQRFALPLIKTIGKQALKGGASIVSDIIPGLNLAKKNLKRKAASTLRNLGDTIEQSGIGRRKKSRKTVKSSPALKGSGRKKKRRNRQKLSFKKDIFKTF